MNFGELVDRLETQLASGEAPRLETLTRKKKKMNTGVRMPEELIHKLDGHAARLRTSRNELMRILLEEGLRRYETAKA